MKSADIFVVVDLVVNETDMVLNSHAGAGIGRLVRWRPTYEEAVAYMEVLQAEANAIHDELDAAREAASTKPKLLTAQQAALIGRMAIDPNPPMLISDQPGPPQPNTEPNGYADVMTSLTAAQLESLLGAWNALVGPSSALPRLPTPEEMQAAKERAKAIDDRVREIIKRARETMLDPAAIRYTPGNPQPSNAFISVDYQIRRVPG